MKVIEKLIKLRSGEVSTLDSGNGICFELALCSDIKNIGIHDLFKKWPEFSGDVEFPVPSFTEGMDAEDAYMKTDNKDMWNCCHPYGAARFRLVDFLIKELQATSKE